MALSTSPTFPQVFTRWLQVRCPGKSHGRHDGSCSDFPLFISTVILIQAPAWAVATISKCLQTCRLSPRAIHPAFCQISPWEVQPAPQIQHHKTQLSSLHPPPSVTACAFEVLWVHCTSKHPIIRPNKQGSSSPKMPPSPVCPNGCHHSSVLPPK